MIHVGAIENALAGNHLGTVERAFCALVSFPEGERIDGAKSVETLCRLLDRVTRALRTDDAAMPPTTRAIIAGFMKGCIGAGASYAAGAAVVADHQYHWRGVFLQHAANNGRL